MMTIPFHREHLAAVELGAEEQVEYARFGPGLFGALAEWQGPACSLVGNRGQILGCFGMHAVGREGVVWAVLSDEARARPFGLHRAAKGHLDKVERLGLTDRILTVVRDGHDAGQRWITRLGFTYDGDIEVSNLHYRRYVKWQQHQRWRSSVR
jgi:hypothetical protein